MTYLDSIKEECIILKDHPDLLHLIDCSTSFTEQRPLETFVNECPCFHIVYIEKNQKFQLIKAFPIKSEDEFEVELFKQLLIVENPISFEECLYVTSLFDPTNIGQFLQLRDPFKAYDGIEESVIDEILSESRRNLVYHYQVEKMYRMLTGCSTAKALSFRKELYKKKDGAWAEQEVIKFSNGKSLKDVMDQRKVSEFTVFPNLHGAMNLFELVTNS